MVRDLEYRRRQAIDAYEREVRAGIQRAVDEHNRQERERVRRINQVIDTHNREVQAHNARVRADRQRLMNELDRLARQAAAPRYVTFRVSVDAVQTSYERLERAARAGDLGHRYNEVLDLSEREAANNAGLMNALLGKTDSSEETPPDLLESPLSQVLQAISAELCDRWQGALFALNPRNRDAARHFCASSREIIARILDVKAPNCEVIAALPDCPRTQQGGPTRRAKISYFLQLQGMNQAELEGFIETDMENVVQLFEVFNAGTHGSAGTFDLAQLQAIRKRVEDGILFLSRIVP